ncbi:plant cysteine oxidase 3-like [Macadamia integrifolia]|uniref:plant cysteine oxidase 3-like n=1 Tax=Macadamia integrifolia TaxID=60698 RepID=UPI001C500DDB|nr:plant cysteine oxidase 3-like [Macadamia integrifolia]
MNNTMNRSKIQWLYDACNLIFTQEEPPTFQKIQWLKKLIDTMEAIDVGIDEFKTDESLTRWARKSSVEDCEGLICGQGVSEITYIHIYESNFFSIGVFCFPAGAKLPLHDHPSMTVLSKLLYGSVYVKAYDWVKVEKSNYRTVGLAAKVIDGIIKAPSEATVLFPKNGGNIHSFTALTPCAILDVLSPPYSDDLGRPSTYFSEIFVPSLRGYAILEERDLPDDLVVTGAPYLGPRLITSDDSDEFS